MTKSDGRRDTAATTQCLVSLNGLIALVVVARTHRDLLTDIATGVAQGLHLFDALIQVMLIDTDLARGRTIVAGDGAIFGTDLGREHRRGCLGNDTALLGRRADIDAGELDGRVGGYGVVPGDQGIGGAINRECRAHARVARNKIDRITLLSPKCVRIRCLAGTVHDFGHARPRKLPHASLKQAGLAGGLPVAGNNGRRVCRSYPLLRSTDGSGTQ